MNKKKNNNSFISQEKIDIIYKVAKKLAHRYTFGYYDTDDIIQEAAIIGLNGLKKVSKKIKNLQDLENFLYVHIKNRLFNFRRDNYERLKKIIDNTSKCEVWETKQSAVAAAKKNLMSPISMDVVSDEKEKNMAIYSDIGEKVDMHKMCEYIDEQLPINYRRDYIKFLFGEKLPKDKLENLISEIKKIGQKFA